MCYINYLETLINYNGMHLQKKLKLTFSSMKRKSKINVTTETCILDETENILQMINPMRLPTCKQNIFFKLFYNRCNDFLLYKKKKSTYLHLLFLDDPHMDLSRYICKCQKKNQEIWPPHLYTHCKNVEIF